MQGPHCEGLGVEDFIPAERAADQAVEFGGAGASRRSAAEKNASVRARCSGIVMVRLVHRDGEEVGAVGPCVEMGERIDTFCGSTIDHAARLDAVITGI